MKAKKISKGIYETEAGSILEYSGRYTGINEITFYWSDEMNACIDCEPNTCPEWDGKNIVLTWTCKNCGGGKAILVRTAQQGK